MNKFPNLLILDNYYKIGILSLMGPLTQINKLTTHKYNHVIEIDKKLLPPKQMGSARNGCPVHKVSMRCEIFARHPTVSK